MDVHSRVVANEVGREVHDDRDGEQRDDAAQGRQRHGQGDIPLGEHGKDVGRAASRRAGNQHEADEEQRVELEHPADGECQQRLRKSNAFRFGFVGSLRQQLQREYENKRKCGEYRENEKVHEVDSWLREVTAQ